MSSYTNDSVIKEFNDAIKNGSVDFSARPQRRHIDHDLRYNIVNTKKQNIKVEEDQKEDQKEDKKEDQEDINPLISSSSGTYYDPITGKRKKMSQNLFYYRRRK